MTNVQKVGFGILGLLVVALGTALVTVVSVRDLDALATLALTLAILAFLVQLVIFAVQLWISTQQDIHSAGLFSETKILLSSVQSSTNESLYMLREQLRPLILRGVDQALEQEMDVSKTKGDKNQPTPTFAERVVQNVEDAVVEAPSTVRQSLRPSRDATARALERLKARREAAAQSPLMTFPDASEGGPLLDALEHLTPPAAAYLGRFANDELESLMRGTEIGLKRRSVDDPLARELLGAGLIEMKPQPAGSDEVPMFVLTDHGRQVARLVSGQGVQPPWLREALSPPPGPETT